MKRLSHAELQCLVAFASFLFLGVVGSLAPAPAEVPAANPAQVFIGMAPQVAAIEPPPSTF